MIFFFFQAIFPHFMLPFFSRPPVVLPVLVTPGRTSSLPPGPVAVPVLGAVSVIWALLRGKSLLDVLSEQRRKHGPGGPREGRDGTTGALLEKVGLFYKLVPVSFFTWEAQATAMILGSLRCILLGWRIFWELCGQTWYSGNGFRKEGFYTKYSSFVKFLSYASELLHWICSEKKCIAILVN